MAAGSHESFFLRVIDKLTMASCPEDFTEIMMEAFQEDGDSTDVEAQVVTDSRGTFWSDWNPLERLIRESGVSFEVDPAVITTSSREPSDNGTTPGEPWLGSDVWFETATRYKVDFEKYPFVRAA